MSIEDLQADIDRNTADLDARPILTMDDVKAVLKDTILPLFKTVANEMEEIDDDLSDLVEHADSILQEEDAAMFALLIKGSVEIAQALTKRLKPNDNDNRWKARIQQFMQLAQTASARLVEITVAPDENEDPDDGDEGPDADDAPVDAAPHLSSVPANEEKR